jgi:hypothetical protein
MSAANTYWYAGIKYNVLDLFFAATIASFDDLKLNEEALDHSWWPKKSVPVDQVAFESVSKVLNHLGYLKD